MEVRQKADTVGDIDLYFKLTLIVNYTVVWVSILKWIITGLKRD